MLHAFSSSSILRPLQLFLYSAVLREFNLVIIIYLLTLDKANLSKQSPLWMGIPGGTASRGNSNTWRADSEAEVFKILHV